MAYQRERFRNVVRGMYVLALPIAVTREHCREPSPVENPNKYKFPDMY
jgi:hypothetical protein